MSGATAVAELLRERPTLPADPCNGERPWTDFEPGRRLPRVTCAFRGCADMFDDYAALRAHITEQGAGGHALAIQEATERQAVGQEYEFYCEAISIRERKTVPTVGYSIDRRCFELTSLQYNDHNIKSLMCLICGQIKPMTPGPRSLIEMKNGEWLFGNVRHGSQCHGRTREPPVQT